MPLPKSPGVVPSELTTAQRVAIWMRSLPTLTPDDKRYVRQMQDATGLSQPECSRIKKGDEATWTIKRWDEVAEHRGTTVPQLMLEIWAVSERQAEPKRDDWHVPDKVVEQYARFIKAMAFDDPRRVKMTMIQFEEAFKAGLACLFSDLAHTVLSLGPENAFMEMAGTIEAFLKSEPPLDRKRREKQQKEYLRRVAEISR